MGKKLKKSKTRKLKYWLGNKLLPQQDWYKDWIQLDAGSLDKGCLLDLAITEIADTQDLLDMFFTLEKENQWLMINILAARTYHKERSA